MISLALTILGVALAAGSHCSVSRQSPPTGWGYVYGAYEISVPTLLAVSIAVPTARPVAVAIAAGVALGIGVLSVWVASHAGPALREIREQASVARVMHGGIWPSKPASRIEWSVDIDGPILELQRRRREHRAPPPEV